MKSLWKNPLAREITLVLLFKLVFIFALWFMFFRHPVDEGLVPGDLGQAVFGNVSIDSAPSKE